MKLATTRILIAVPIFNEEKYVAPVLREIRKYSRASALAHNVETRVLVIDDGSTDRTPALLADLAARNHIDLLTHPENRGYGQSLIDAFSFDSARHYDWVITMDCDEQHEPCRIPLFVRECLKDDADIISGSRYLWPEYAGTGAPPPDRRNINRLITELLNASLHLRFLDTPTANGSGMTDSFCGFKAHRVSAMNQLALTIPGYAFPMQFWVQADAHRLRIREIPVKLIYKDATRHFGGMLDDPSARLQHYLEVLTTELKAVRETVPAFQSECAAVCDE
ncbi:MAG TPA: glycosyltransferase family 2 protein [Phycisphaerae bacterium]|nr:glycosyltransferase family 2 protein [Phycisphaerae bacterium]